MDILGAHVQTIEKKPLESEKNTENVFFFFTNYCWNDDLKSEV